ncbi:hypothetical protein ACFL6U_23875, partial [Planctomycetota bacterium]
MKGALDDIRVYTKALTLTELNALMAEGAVPPPPENPLMIESFDNYRSYNAEADPNIWDVWTDGYSDSSNGSTSGNLGEPFMEHSNAQAGGQAMPMGYNNFMGTSV